MKSPRTKKKSAGRKPRAKRQSTSKLRRAVRWLIGGATVVVGIVLLWILVLSFLNPPTTLYMNVEKARLGKEVKHQWVDFDDVAPVMARSIVAAEDANFCRHWGFDISALRQAIEEGANRGASTLSQQTVKNVFLWQGRTYTRKALEAVITPVMEAFWSKRRILEVYLNVAEFDEGVFGVAAASQHYFGVTPSKLSSLQAARLAAILPNPKSRSAINPGAFTKKRALGIKDGAETIRRDGRDDCFAD